MCNTASEIWHGRNNSFILACNIFYMVYICFIVLSNEKAYKLESHKRKSITEFFISLPSGNKIRDRGWFSWVIMDLGYITLIEHPFWGSLVATNTHSAKSILSRTEREYNERGIPVITSFFIISISMSIWMYYWWSEYLYIEFLTIGRDFRW